MRYFHDKDKSRWEIELNLGAAKRVYDALSIDLLNPAFVCDDGRTVSARLCYDDLTLGRVVAELVAPQAEARQVSRDELEANFDAKRLCAAEAAFFAEWRDFFTQRGKAWATKAIELDHAEKERGEKAALESMRTLEAERLGATSSDSPDEPESPTSAS